MTYKPTQAAVDAAQLAAAREHKARKAKAQVLRERLAAAQTREEQAMAKALRAQEIREGLEYELSIAEMQLTKEIQK